MHLDIICPIHACLSEQFTCEVTLGICRALVFLWVFYIFCRGLLNYLLLSEKCSSSLGCQLSVAVREA